MDKIILETRHYYRIPYEITDTLKFKQMKPTTQVLYMTMCRLANDKGDNEGWFFHSLNDIAEKSGLDRKTVILAKTELEKNNYIDVKKSQYLHGKRRACNYYRINGFSFRIADSDKNGT